MKAWEIWNCQPDGWNEPHPAVIVSHPLRVANKLEVDVVMCSTRRAQRAPAPHEVLLDEADGLDWPTLCKLPERFGFSPDAWPSHEEAA